MTKSMKPRSALRSRSAVTRGRAGPRHQKKKLDATESQSMLRGPDVGAQTGLGAAIAKTTWEAARDANDAHTIRALRMDLDKMMEGPDARTRSRANFARVLRAIVDRLRPSMSTHLNTLRTGVPIVTDHPAVAFLDESLDDLSDLDNGRTPDIFEPATHGATATLTAKQRQRDRIWLLSVEILKRRFGLPTKSAAERLLAAKLRKAHETRRGKPVTAQTLKSLRDHNRKT
jgi:hypothetical protein